MNSTEKLNRLFGNENFDPNNEIWDTLTKVHPEIPHDTVFDNNTEKQNDYIYVCLRSLDVYEDGSPGIPGLDQWLEYTKQEQDNTKVYQALANVQNRDIRIVLAYLMSKVK